MAGTIKRMEMKLKVAQGKNAGQLLAVTGPRFLIGRADTCHLRPRSDSVAEQQCVIELEPAKVILRNLANNESTVLNGAVVKGQCELKSGDQLKVGPLEFEVQLTTGMASKKAPKVQSVEDAATRLAAGRKKELDPSAWLDEPAEEAEEAPELNRSTKMTDEQRAALGLLTPEEIKAREAKQAPASQLGDASNRTQQAAAEHLSKLLRKKP